MSLSVFYTHDIFSSQRFGGISRYFNELTRELRLIDGGPRLEVFAGLSMGETEGKLGIRVPAFPHTRFLRHFVNELWQRNRLRSFDPDLIHVTYPFQDPEEYRKKLVITVHDMIPEAFPDQLGQRDTSSLLKKKYCERADLIIAVSEATKRELIQRFNVSENKVRVVHHGVSSMASPSLVDLMLGRPYFLYVGTMESYKNFDRLWAAFSGSSVLPKTHLLVVMGTQRPPEKAISGGVRYFSGGDDVLKSLFQGATALVYPSLCEGFGMPLLEAMVQGCPVLASRIPAFLEVAGDAALYFDPLAVEEMRSSMERMVSERGLASQLAKVGAERAGMYSWSACARATWATYRELA